MIIQSQRSMNYKDPLAMELHSLTTKRGKTLEDRIRISDLEMELGFYYDEKIGPYMPAFNLKTCIHDGATMIKFGKHVKQSLRSIPGHDRFPIEYQGPRDLASLIADPRFRDTRNVVVSKRGVERTRPTFPVPWEVKGLYVLDEERLDLHRLRECVRMAGKYIGLGGFLPEFGIFQGNVAEVKVDPEQLGIDMRAAV